MFLWSDFGALAAFNFVIAVRLRSRILVLVDTDWNFGTARIEVRIIKRGRLAIAEGVRQRSPNFCEKFGKIYYIFEDKNTTEKLSVLCIIYVKNYYFKVYIFFYPVLYNFLFLFLFEHFFRNLALTHRIL